MIKLNKNVLFLYMFSIYIQLPADGARVEVLRRGAGGVQTDAAPEAGHLEPGRCCCHFGCISFALFLIIFWILNFFKLFFKY